VADRILLSAGRKNIEACIELAVEQELGIEVMNFAFPDVLDGAWERDLVLYQQILTPVPGLITMHGPFFDMTPGSPDKQIEAVVERRYKHAIEIAQALNAKIVVFHANFIASLHNEEYRVGWQKRNAEFWSPIAEFAAAHDVTLAVENMWEFDPFIITDVLHAVDHPNLRACLDVGHAHLFSKVPFTEWLRVVEPYLVHVHMNNNDGKLDYHRAFPDGVLDYHQILTLLHALPNPVSMTLEMDTVDDMRRSLSYFGVTAQTNPSALADVLDAALDSLNDAGSPITPSESLDIAARIIESGILDDVVDSAFNADESISKPDKPRSKGDTAEHPRVTVTAD